MLETIVSEKRVALPPPPPQVQQQPMAAPQLASQPAPAGRFKGMLARAGTLNGRKTSMPIPAPAPIPVPDMEKALPPPFTTSPSPGYTPTPETHPLVDPMGDNAPVSLATPLAIPEKPLVAEPQGGDDVPPQTPAKTEAPGLPNGSAGAGGVNGEVAHPLAEGVS